jgi:hypothetical protein
MATAPSPNDLTRQQLDELDALLQRMLSVPLAPADTPMPVGGPALPTPPVPTPASPPPDWRIDPPMTANAPAPHLLFAEAIPSMPKVEEPPAPVAKPQVASTAVSTTPPAKVAPAPLPKAPTSASSRVTPVPAAPPVPFTLLPFVALNFLFNTLCGLFGLPGRLLRSGFFKYLYGLSGLGLLAYTAAHVAQTQGWLSLPVALPWPR